jgi:hypothetical protein
VLTRLGEARRHRPARTPREASPAQFRPKCLIFSHNVTHHAKFVSGATPRRPHGSPRRRCPIRGQVEDSSRDTIEPDRAADLSFSKIGHVHRARGSGIVEEPWRRARSGTGTGPRAEGSGRRAPGRVGGLARVSGMVSRRETNSVRSAPRLIRFVRRDGLTTRDALGLIGAIPKSLPGTPNASAPECHSVRSARQLRFVRRAACVGFVRRSVLGSFGAIRGACFCTPSPCRIRRSACGARPTQLLQSTNGFVWRVGLGSFGAQRVGFDRRGAGPLGVRTVSFSGCQRASRRSPS